MAAVNVIWYQGAGCSGCSVSVLNSVSPDIKEILLADLAPGKSINLLFQPTVMAAGGELAAKVLEDAPKKPGYVLILEGALPKGEISEKFCRLVPDSMAVIALGSCAAFGNIPKAAPNPSGAFSAGDCLKENKIDKPLINISGCPPHPDWFAGTVFHILFKGIPELDELNRPKLFYERLVHENCERRPYFDKGKFAKNFTEEGCLFELGCKGPYTNADCPVRSWNNHINWCVQNGHPCIGCTEPEFPDVLAPFYKPLKIK
ncbi:MAG: hydrogenase small subunit [bacterium]